MKSRLRHPVRAIREPFGTAGLIIAVVALIAALGGTALAAGGLTSQQEKQVKKIAKKFAGKPGANGTNGTNGTNGKSVTTGSLAAGEEGCVEGGAFVQVAGEAATKKPVCSGEEGPKGDPWTPNSALPANATETGAWFYPKTEVSAHVVIGFPIKLASKVKTHLIYTNGKELALNETTFEVEEVTSTHCTGTAENPKADSGHFCLYIAKQTGTITLGATPGEITESSGSFADPGTTTFGLGTETGLAGAQLKVTRNSGFTEGWGTWAVTG